jgi:hypothetical protein
LSSALGAVLAAFAVAGAAASCSTFSSNDAPPPVITGDGGAEGAPAACSPDLTRDAANCGQCGHACATTEACESGACRPGCADKKVYVSTTGDDANDGCTVTHPMKSIGAAIARVKAIGAKDHAVTVCRGGYKERALVIDYPVSLRGGYECSQFTRTKDFGYPLFDAATETNIDDGNEGVDRFTLTVKGAAVTRAVVVDGFTINGATSGDARSIAVSVQAGAAVTLTDLKVVGGGTAAPSGIGAVGIASAVSSPEIARTVVHGGIGTAVDSNADNIGIYASGGAPFLHDLQVAGTAGVDRTRSYGILVDGAAQATGANAWNHVAVSGVQATLVSVGIFLVGNAHLELADGLVTGGKINCQAVGCSAYGMLVSGSVATVQSSRIYGGDLVNAGSPPYASSAFGFYVDAMGAAPSVFTNNVIVGGNSSRRADLRVIAALFTRTAGSRLVHNTVIVPEANGAAAGNTVAIWASNGASNLEIDDNLVVGENGTALVGLHLERDCNSLPLSSIKFLRGNAFVGTARVLDLYAGAAGCQFTPATTLTDAVAALPGVTTTNNVRLAASCDNDTGPSCLACSPATTCAPLVLAPWTPAVSPSAAELFAAASYSMPSSAPCLVAKGAVVLSPMVTQDAMGNPRVSPASIGASQIAGACSP